MYPWVNRHTNDRIRLGEEWISLSSITNKDKNGYPIHGLGFAWKRKILQKTEDSIQFELSPEKELLNSSLGNVIVRETYSLRRIFNEEILTLKTDFLNHNSYPFRFCYGYHPYFRIQSDKQSCVLRSNLSKQIPLKEDLTPIYPIYTRETDRFRLEKIPVLDSLFLEKTLGFFCKFQTILMKFEFDLTCRIKTIYNFLIFKFIQTSLRIELR